MYTERSMGLRALTILPPPGLALAAMPSMTNRSGVCLRLMTTDYDSDDELPDTIPPPAGDAPSVLPSAPPEGTSTLEEIAKNEDPANWAGYDESKFMHRATKAVIAGTNELLKARQIWDIESIVKRQSVLFTDALKPQFDALGTRIGENETAVSALRRELHELKQKFEQEVSRLEGEIASLRK